MRLVGKIILDQFARSHADTRVPLDAWICEVEDADWSEPSDVKSRYPSASLLPENTVIFNIKGNRYRLEVKVHYQLKVVTVSRVGTHAEYSSWK